MTQQNRWHATVGYTGAPSKISDTQAETLMAHLPGYAGAVHEGNGIHLEMTIEAATLRKATEDALKAANTAYAAAFHLAGTPTALQVLTEADHEQEQANPSTMDLVGIAEIADKADVSRQRAQQLTVMKGFPAPVAELKATKVFTAKSVDTFLQHWERKPGRPAKV